MAKFEIGEKAITYDGFLVKVIDVAEEDGVTYYECKPVGFDSISRMFAEDKLGRLIVWEMD